MWQLVLMMRKGEVKEHRKSKGPKPTHPTRTRQPPNPPHHKPPPHKKTK